MYSFVTFNTEQCLYPHGMSRFRTELVCVLKCTVASETGTKIYVLFQGSMQFGVVCSSLSLGTLFSGTA
jgi:hypothetical protein